MRAAVTFVTSLKLDFSKSRIFNRASTVQKCDLRGIIVKKKKNRDTRRVSDDLFFPANPMIS